MNKRLLVSISIFVMLGGSLLLAVTLAGARPTSELKAEAELKPVRQPSGRTITVTPWGLRKRP